MNDIKNIRFEMWIDGDRDVSAFHLSRNDNAVGLKNVWFVLDRYELEQLAKGTVTSLQDGYHYLSIFGSSCTFYDFMLPSNGAGVASVPYFSVDLPRVFWKYLLRMGRFAWKQARIAKAECDVKKDYWSGNRLEVNLPIETLKRFTDRYGRGKGNIVCHYSERLLSELQTRPAKANDSNYRSLAECVQQVESIGKGYTHSIYDKLEVNISNDWGGYYFRFFNKMGRVGLNGGIVNHAERENGDNWSIHT